MNKKRKIIVKIWFIFILIILLILLFLLGLSLPKLPLFKKQSQNNQDKQTQHQPQTQYIYDTNKVNNIINLMNAFKRLKELKELQYQKQLETKQESYDSIVKLPQPEINYIPDKTKTNNDELIKGIAITTLGAGAVIIAAVAFPPIFASLGASLGQMAPVMTLLL
ncbi:hypothetical protein J8J04_02680 ['Fragaria x ananassa' phyllody phytoplasma]|uniref:Uncharacterized protein n=1 Tax='Fragaria x ananassa' phyllody phytoplasma TaxID=2358428 RepID=A0ABS5K3S0_9MOLU|nr:hypothetical protein ['Fragaria x ananassa' phyllody phytoplasma]MBS2126573.1 hypothetical protein ['Fragaria x ananassa' phyllody phytoplasma]MBS2126578.1 hypothetical protein ['Fragaria x ananassa' phyllody phytoplasma]